MRKLVITLALIAVVSQAVAAAGGGRQLTVTFTGPDGKPIPRAELKKLYLRDMTGEPLVCDITREDGSALVVLPDKPVQISVLFNVPEFGEVVVFADGKGKGYTRPGTVDFVSEAAATRLLRVKSALTQAKAEGVVMPDEFARKLQLAGKSSPYKSLAITLAAGEELTLARARHRIAQMKGPRKEFLFGCNSMGHPKRGPLYDERFKGLFNYGTANLYLTGYAPSPTVRNFSRTDTEVNWLLSEGMAARTCPPLYFANGVLPEWLKNRPWSELRPICHDLMLEVAKRYTGKVAVCEITNEAHMSNGLSLSASEILDLTRVASEAASEGDPNVKRMINSAHLWGDYAAKLDKRGRKKLSPYAYLHDCIKAGIPFEVVGLQMYYPEYDLMEIDRMLDRYATLGKEIHITEMGCSSAPGLDPNAQRKRASAGWHGPWTEDMQADWVEAIYTICYSKPYIKSVAWWDLADAVSFWPYGGLLRGDLSPKPAYLRLQALFKKWGYSPIS